VAGVEQAFDPLSRVALQNIDPVWAVEQTHRLCKKGEEEKFRGKARLLDHTKYNSIRGAVGLLNGLKEKGEASGAFCIVFSQHREEYFLLYKRMYKKLAFMQFDVREQWSLDQAEDAWSSVGILSGERNDQADDALCKKGEELQYSAATTDPGPESDSCSEEGDYESCVKYGDSLLRLDDEWIVV